MVTLPSRQSPIEAMAFGRGGSSEPATDLGVDEALAALDRSTVAPPRAAQRSAKLVAENKTPAAAPVEQAEATAAASQQFPILLAENTQESRYASREAKSDEQQKFAGGDAIIITSGAIVLVLLIVLLILLLR